MRRVMRMTAGSLLLAAALAGCGSSGTGEPAVAETSPFVGRPEAELIRARGVPNRTTEAGGSRFLVYETGGGGGGSPSFGVGVGGGSGGSGIGVGLGFPIFGGGSRLCTTTFEVRDGQVVGSRAEPAGCS